MIDELKYISLVSYVSDIVYFYSLKNGNTITHNKKVNVHFDPKKLNVNLFIF
jgi:hypothetical protein